MSLDQYEIEDFFNSNFKIHGQDDESFADVQYLYTNDINNNSYTEGQIKFNLTSTGDKFQILRDSYLVLPLKAVSSGTAYDATTRLAIKTSLLSLIQGLTVTTADGSLIVSEQSGATPIINNLRLLIESGLDFKNSVAQEIHFGGKDTKTTLTTAVQTLNSDVTGGSTADSTDPRFNQGLSNRVAIFNATATYASAGFTFVAYIPLRHIHGFFDQCSFPLVNCPLLITFNIAGTNNFASYQPFTTVKTLASGSAVDAADATLLEAVDAINAADKPVVSIDNTVSEMTTGFTPGGCRLYIKTVKFNSSTASKIAAKISQGFTRYIDYTISELHEDPVATLVTTSNKSVSRTITTAAIRPRRIWCLPVADGTLNSGENVFPGSMGSFFLSGVNLQVNNQNVLQANLNTQYEMYKMLASQATGSDASNVDGCHVSYIDYLYGMNPVVFDVSRVKQLDLNHPCTLQFEANIKSKSGDQSLKMVYVLERSVTLKLNFSSAGVVSTISNGTVRT